MDGFRRTNQPREFTPSIASGLFLPERGNVPVLLAARCMEAVCCYAGEVHSPAGAV